MSVPHDFSPYDGFHPDDLKLSYDEELKWKIICCIHNGLSDIDTAAYLIKEGYKLESIFMRWAFCVNWVKSKKIKAADALRNIEERERLEKEENKNGKIREHKANIDSATESAEGDAVGGEGGVESTLQK